MPTPSPGEGARSRRRPPVLPGLALLGVAASLLLRAWWRGHYYPGWDILGSAQGLYVLSTSRPLEAVARLIRGVTEFRYWNSTNSLPYTLVPGALGRLWPSEYWAHWLTLALVLATLGLVLRFADLPLRKAWVLALVWGASPALLSFSVAGYPYATGFLPHALALVIVTSPGLRARPVVSLAAALLATELSWHLYEAGKTLVVVFILGALLERSAPLATRAGWLAASAVQLVRLFGRRGFNVDYVVAGVDSGPRSVAAAAGRTLEALLSPGLDLPLVVPLGLLAILLVPRHRWLLLGGIASQVLTVALAAAVDASAIRPRRLLTTTFYCLTAVAVAIGRAGPATGRRRLLPLCMVTALACGNLWQIADLWLFFEVPPAGRSQPLPHTQSADDYFVAAGASELAREVRAEVDRGRAVVLLHNLSSEVLADPEALLERVYVTTGHERFGRFVLAFGRRHCRYDCLPVRDLEAVEADLDTLAATRAGSVAFYKKALAPRRHVEEAAIVLAALRSRFAIRPGLDPAPGFGRLELTPGPPVPPRLVVTAPTAPLPLDLAWLPNPREPGGIVRTSPAGDRPFRHDWSASVIAVEAVSVDLLLGCAGRLRLSVDGVPVVTRESHGFTLWREPLHLPPGRHALGLEYETRSGSGRLLLQAEAALPERP